MKPRDAIAAAINAAVAGGRPALVGFLTAGFPSRQKFKDNLAAVLGACDVVEIGVPFSDPMADGTTIQRASFAALADGVTLPWILEELGALSRQGGSRGAAPGVPRSGVHSAAPSAAPSEGSSEVPSGVPVGVPILLMSYLNPLLQFGLENLPRAAAAAGVAGFIVPDLPYEESGELQAALAREGLALIQMVTPVTPDDRLAMLCKAAQGFIYAVTMTGTTGKSAAVPDDVLAYMDRVKRVASIPVCAGFGIRSREQVARFAAHVDGVVVGSALVEALERGEDVGAFLGSLRGSGAAARFP
jgi:tryptophan synthase alpha chain